MNFRTLTKRSLRFHWRSHLGVVLGAAIGSAALIGALIVGDSVNGSLRERALLRLGWTTVAMSSGDRLFYSGLADHYISKHYGQPWTARASAVLHSTGVAIRPDGEGRANNVSIFGIDKRFGEEGTLLARIPKGTVAINKALADQLSLKVGDDVVLRMQSVSGPSADMVMTPKGNAARTVRMKVSGIAAADQMANFSLLRGSTPQLNAFLNLEELSDWFGMAHQANVLLLGRLELPRKSRTDRLFFEWQRFLSMIRMPSKSGEYARANPEEVLEFASKELLNVGSPGFWGIILQVDERGWLEINSREVFIPSALAEAACNVDTNTWGLVFGIPPTEMLRPFEIQFLEQPAQPLLTYPANLITVGSNTTPYSMVTAAGAPWTPPGLQDDEIVLNQWLADDLQAKPGDALSLVYFDPESGARLTERTNTFRVHSIVPMEMPWADRTLMPQFPGIEKAETTAEWDTAFPLVNKIRPQDDDYWTQWRGTPKAFITLAAGQKMWANRFGNLTAIRFPIPTNGVSSTSVLTPALSPGERENPSPSPDQSKVGDISTASGQSKSELSLSPLPGGEDQGEGERSTNSLETFRSALEKKILATLKPEELGLRFEPVREQALKAAEQSQDFGGLFIGFSLFVIVAALLLMVLLFQFSLEQRTAEIGTLLALGFTPKQVRRLFLREGLALAFVGGMLGTLGGIGYAKAMLLGLTTLWSDAVGGSALKFFVTPQTLLIGLFASTAVAVFTLWLALRKQAGQPARALLVGVEAGPQTTNSVPNRGRGLIVAVFAIIGALSLIAWTLAKGDTANAGAFFGAGALLLIAGLGVMNVRLANLGCDTLKQTSPATLAWRGLARRRSRSVATAAMLACGTFLIVSIGVFRLDANRDATKRTSGTGGFALIGESTMPVVADLNTKAGRESFALIETDFTDVNFVQFRVRAGDEASCLNLNRAQKPRLLGVDVHAIWDRFTFVANLDDQTKAGPWGALTHLHTTPRWEKDEVPAIGDAASIQWAMGKKVGDTLDYVDERGQPFKVRIVGAVANSILQGQLIIDEAEFLKRFPGESGYKYFLIDVPTNRVAEVSAKLSRALQDVGLELTPAPQRLAQFNAVQNTYLGTFQILGGLGLLLGSAGLGIVVLRNVLERRGELAVLLAVGWPRSAVSQLVLREHLALLGLGLLVGLAAAIVAVLPSVLAPAAALPWLSLSLTLAAVLANGALWTWVATRVALRGELLSTLRGE